MTSFIISLAVRLTILLIAGGLIALAARRSTYAVRHIILATTLGCIIALPATMRLIPEWRVGVLPAALVSQQLNSSAQEHATSSHASIRAVLVTSSMDASLPANVALATSTASSSGSASNTASSHIATSSLATSPRVAALSALSSLAHATPLPHSLRELALAVWLLGVIVGLAWIAAGRIGLARVRRRATPLTSYEWRAILEAEAMHARVARPVALLMSADVSTPVTWGILSPVIALPEAAREWPHDRRRVVVMHEMAHIARRDSATQLMATLACVAYWIHPLVILAARRLRAECERACDERVL
ncbi:MAG: M56 family metallopeptidase, partial [Gemmatimonadaceae bacterium]|nr:M56 family metallopeptidase [Gemmatimonadaceae bacterium]